MPASVRVNAIVDVEGRIVAMELAAEPKRTSREGVPRAHLETTVSQRAIQMDVPRDVLNLSGPELHRFLADVRITWPAEVRLPKMKVVKKR